MAYSAPRVSTRMDGRRSVTVSMSNALWKRLDNLAKYHDLSKQQLLENLIFKLCDENGGIDFDPLS